MKHRQVLHCERCGNDVAVQRGGHFRDEDYYELHHEYFALERELRVTLARLHLEEVRLKRATESVEELRSIVNELLPEPAAEEFGRDCGETGGSCVR